MSQNKYIQEIAKIFPALMRYFHNVAGEISRIGDFSLAQYRILMILYHRGTLTIGDLKQMLGNAQSSVSEMIARMEEQGLVKRDKNPKDRRQTLLSLTKKASHLIEIRKEKMNDVYYKFLEGKSEEEQADLVETLRHLQQLLEKRTAD
ncbi:MAG: MarR family transcriptional regulator [Calditrichaeota bacterium]|nr:MarR family transcriptional regulator [Calditrichota bacterium]